MPEIRTATPMSISTAAFEWGVQAQRIVAYPEDFGMTREQVGSLARALAQRRSLPGRQVVPGFRPGSVRSGDRRR